MPLLGAHMSIAGGFHKAVEAAAALGMETVQIFTHSPSQWAVKPIVPADEESLRSGNLLSNNSQWRAKEVTPAEADTFQQKLRELSVRHPISHSSYLINLAAPDNALWKKSIDAFIVELIRADTLRIPLVVVHPGCYTTSTEEVGIRRVVQSLNEVHRQTTNVRARCLLETTAGQGSSIGHAFEHLAAILDSVDDPDRLGICFDTCHVFAAGYPLQTIEEYEATMRSFHQIVGRKQIKAFHLNDSKRGLGCRVDRHEHIGRGCMGLEPFRHLLNDGRFAKVPMYLETPKGRVNGHDWDEINLAALRKLVQPTR
jgi:deoxyribonuclease-4